MRIILGCVALLLALAAGYLAVMTAGPALTIHGGMSIPAGQLRGMVFVFITTAASVGLLALAASCFGWISPQSRLGR